MTVKRAYFSTLPIFSILLLFALVPARPSAAQELAERLAAEVTIYRDRYGVPHVDAATDAGAAFGYAYAQAEDYFWQVEDTYLMCIGRYSEAVGQAGLRVDLLNRTFEIPSRSEADYQGLEPELKAICEGYVAGLNDYLKNHPETRPRVIERFEPWFVLAFGRFMLLNFVYGKAHAPRPRESALQAEIRKATGSNAWAIGPSKTASGAPMLFVNPHQPWFGAGQWYEGHVRSREGLNFSGAGFFGGPLPSIGHNENLGWTHTVNEPDIADVYRVTFDDPSDRLNYRYDGGYRKAVEWRDTIKVRTAEGLEERTYTFRKTHHGPIVSWDDERHALAVRVARLYEGNRLRQSLAMLKAKNFDQWLAGMGQLSLQMFNTVYADREGNIFYLYNGSIPRRDPNFDWTKPVDGSDPKTEWRGLHALAELPQVLNPASGFVQNCNSSPFTTTDYGNPSKRDFPAYMAEDKDDDRRRAKLSRYLLRDLQGTTLDDWERLAFDTTLYWPLTELPNLKRAHARLKSSNPFLAKRVEPYLDHLLDWDCRCEADSTQTTLCVEWYQRLYGSIYPAETLRKKFIERPELKFEELIKAAERLTRLHGDWRVPWGEVHRMQRHASVPDGTLAPFEDSLPSVACLGVPGPLGVAFTVYYSGANADRKKQYGLVGSSFMACYEFGEKIEARTLVQFGASADPESPHYFDQAQLVSERKLKQAWFDWDEVLANSVAIYHPGAE